MNPKLLFTAVLLSLTVVACGGDKPKSSQFNSARMAEPSPLATVPQPDTAAGLPAKPSPSLDPDAKTNRQPLPRSTNLGSKPPSRVDSGESFLAPAPVTNAPAPIPVDSFSAPPPKQSDRPTQSTPKAEAEPARAALMQMSSETAPNAAIEQAIRQEVPGGEASTRYYYNQVDLSGDGIPEVLVYLTGSYNCGSGGCSLMVLSPQGQGGYSTLSQMSLVNVPVIVSSERTAGWNDLMIPVKGGGLAPHYVRMQFNGSGYPENPSMAPELSGGEPSSGTAVMTDADLQGGIPLVR
jgi:hypothetical protein